MEGGRDRVGEGGRDRKSGGGGGGGGGIGCGGREKELGGRLVEKEGD